MGIRTGDRERTAHDVREQRERAEWYRWQYLDALNAILEICHRPDDEADYVQDLDDIETIVKRAKARRW